MTWRLRLTLVPVLFSGALLAQTSTAAPQQTAHPSGPQAERAMPMPAVDDLEQLRGDVQRLKVLLNQMRTNLAFVQSSQSPLKHQFELEADAWQVIVDQMDRRLKRLERASNQAQPLR